MSLCCWNSYICWKAVEGLLLGPWPLKSATRPRDQSHGCQMGRHCRACRGACYVRDCMRAIAKLMSFWQTGSAWSRLRWGSLQKQGLRNCDEMMRQETYYYHRDVATTANLLNCYATLDLCLILRTAKHIHPVYIVPTYCLPRSKSTLKYEQTSPIALFLLECGHL